MNRVVKQNICIRLQESLGGIWNGKNRFRQLAGQSCLEPCPESGVCWFKEGQAKEAM